MSFTKPSAVRRVRGISKKDKSKIKAYLQGAVYCWIKNVNDEKMLGFAAHDLVGGVNKEWDETPLQILFEKHIKRLRDPRKAEKAAGKDLGWILKGMLDKDKRTFEIRKKGLVAGYLYVPRK